MNFDHKSTEEGDLNEKCPNCLTLLSEHNVSDLVRCSLNELNGVKLTKELIVK